MAKNSDNPTDVRPIAGYFRVSTRRQSDEGISEEHQVEKITRARDLYFPESELVWFSDVRTGRNGRRIGYQEMTAGIRRRRFRGVIAYDHTRLLRNAGEWATFLDQVKRTETALCLVQLGICSLTSYGLALLQILGVFGELDSAQKGDQVREVLQRQKALGKKGPGLRPFGWDVDQANALVRNPSEQQTLDFVAARRLDGASWRKIAEELNLAGKSTVTGVAWSGSGLQLVVAAALQRRKIEAETASG